MFERLGLENLGLVRTNLPYFDLGAYGRRLVRAIAEGRNEPWMRLAFQAIEEGIVEGGATANLVVAGLFEAMQNAAFATLEPPDALDDWLGPRSVEAWRDLIEGWTGPGIRSMDAWRRKGR